MNNPIDEDEIHDALSRFDELDEMEQAHLLDAMLDVIEQLHKNPDMTGWRYEEFEYLIEQGGELPQPFSEVTVVGALSGEKHTLFIKMITKLRFNSAGKLIVTLLGKRIKPKPSEVKTDATDQAGDPGTV